MQSSASIYLLSVNRYFGDLHLYTLVSSWSFNPGLNGSILYLKYLAMEERVWSFRLADAQPGATIRRASALFTSAATTIEWTRLVISNPRSAFLWFSAGTSERTAAAFL